ncbi:MAG: hypothetical protein ABID87_05345 [Chloroflexota bacterium]
MLFVSVVAALSASVLLVAGCGGKPAPPPTPATGPAVRLVFVTQPAGATAGTVLETQPAVAAEDAAGNIVTSFRGLAVLTITPGTGASGARLFGGARVGTTDGTVRFRDIAIDKVGEGYTLTVTVGNLSAVSRPFPVSAGAPARLEFTVEPAGAVAGTPLQTQPEVTVVDSYGNTVPGYEGSVTLRIREGPSRTTLSGTTTVKVVNRVARFTDLSIDGTYVDFSLIATSGNLEPASSAHFAITPAAPVKLEFTVQVEGAVAGTPFDGQPKVIIADAFGNVVITSTAPVTVTITPGTGADGAELSGTTTLNASRGLVTYEDLQISLAGTGYKLTATSEGLTPTESEPFDVTAP